MAGAKTGAETIVDGSTADAIELGRTIYLAFKDLAPSRVLVPDPVMAAAILPRTFALDVSDAQRDGIVYTTDGLRAAALWMPRSGDLEPEPEPEPEPVPDMRLREAAGSYAANFEAFYQTLSARHPTGRAYHHLWIVAVHPDLQGRRLGTRILTAHHDYLDENAIPAYLEAASSRLRESYRRLGYEDLDGPIILADGTTPMYPMWREPRPPDDGAGARG